MANPTELIDDLIARTPDWRGVTFAKFREIIHDADPEITEELKWRRPSLPDPDTLFNAMLEGNKIRAVDFYEADKLNETALKALIRSGGEYNLAKVKPARAGKG